MEGNAFVAPGHLPLKKKYSGPTGRPPPSHQHRQEASWMTPEIRKELQNRNSLQEVLQRTDNPEDWQAYQAQCEKVQSMIDKSKSSLGLAHSYNSGAKKPCISPTQRRPAFANGVSEHQYSGHSQGMPVIDPRTAYYQNSASYNSQGMSRQVLSCGPCNRSFYSQQRLDEHLKEHVECPFPECRLSAHIKIIDQHINNQHMLINFANLQIDDDTWIAERKKRFPTAQRAELRRAEQMEKIKRGEKLGKKNKLFNKDKDKYNKTRKRDMNRNRNNGADSLKDLTRSKDNQKLEAKGEPKISASHEVNGEPRGKFRQKMSQRREGPTKACIVVDLFDSDDEFKDGIPAFKGTKKFYESTGEVSYFGMKSMNAVDVKEEISKDTDIGISDDDEEWHTESKEVNTSGALVLGGALGSLMGTYSDSEDENVEMPSSSQDIGNLDTVPPKSTANESKEENKDEMKTENNKQDSHAATSHKGRRRQRHHKGAKAPRAQKRPLATKGPVVSKPFPKRRKTLLEKLLQPDIIHERNIILQCVRFIVQNNFFDVNTNKDKCVEVPNNSSCQEKEAST
nr:nuclear fragile X mental retardation-interacting protein 1-like [Procambarus clarkii]